MKSYIELVSSTIAFVVGFIGLATLLSGLTNDAQKWWLFILIVAAFMVFAGGIIYFAFKGKNVSQKWRFISLGILYILTIFFSIWVGYWLGSATVQSFNPCEEYGIEIVKPADGYTLVDGQATITGSFTKRPPDERIQLIGLAGGQYWPHNVDSVEITKTSWKGQTIGGGDYTALAVYVGDNGRILFDYFQKAGELNGDYPGIDDLPADVIECDSIHIPIP